MVKKDEEVYVTDDSVVLSKLVNNVVNSLREAFKQTAIETRTQLEALEAYA